MIAEYLLNPNTYHILFEEVMYNQAILQFIVSTLNAKLEMGTRDLSVLSSNSL